MSNYVDLEELQKLVKVAKIKPAVNQVRLHPSALHPDERVVYPRLGHPDTRPPVLLGGTQGRH